MSLYVQHYPRFNISWSLRNKDHTIYVKQEDICFYSTFSDISSTIACYIVLLPLGCILFSSSFSESIYFIGNFFFIKHFFGLAGWCQSRHTHKNLFNVFFLQKSGQEKTWSYMCLLAWQRFDQVNCREIFKIILNLVATLRCCVGAAVLACYPLE